MFWDVTLQLADGGQVTIHKVEADSFKKAGHLGSVQAVVEFGSVEEVVAVAEHKPEDEKHTCLVDLSNIFRTAWHASEQDEVGSAYRKTIAFIERHATNFDYVGVCLDKPPYIRQNLDHNYKAHREKSSNLMQDQMRATIERIEELGFHIFGLEGYEADDIIATLVEYTESQGTKVIIFSADKDLMQLVSTNTSMFSSMTQQKYEQDDVLEKFGVHPELVAELLAIWGDKSDNIPGIQGAGPKIAAKWLNEFGDLEGVIANAGSITRKQPGGDGKTLGDVILENADNLRLWLKLTTLMHDAKIDCERLFSPMNPKQPENKPELDLESEYGEKPPAPEDPYDNGIDKAPEVPPAQESDDSRQSTGSEPALEVSPCPSSDSAQPSPDPVDREATDTVPNSGASTSGGGTPDPAVVDAEVEVTEAKDTVPHLETTAMVKRHPDSDMALEPMSPGQAWGIAQAMHRSRMFGDFPNPEAILAIIMTGRTFGMDTVSSLRGFSFIRGRASPSAALLIGLCKRDPMCEYFKLNDTTPTSATWETKRRDEPSATLMTYTLEEAEQAGITKRGKNNQPSQYELRPKTMLRWRCGTELARVVYPDICSGLYTPEELEDR